MSVIDDGEFRRESLVPIAPTGTRMILNRLVVVCVALCFAARPAIAAAQPASGPGRLEGVVVRQDGSGVGGVVMLVQELGLSELTDTTGKYVFGRVAPGTYTVLATLGPHALREPGVVITSRTTTTLRTVVEWPLSIFESVVVDGTTRQPARLVEAPAAVTVVGSDELAAQAPHGQLPRVLAGAPGVELTQSGLYDFNLNSRGFNTLYNQSILTRIDGRDPSLPYYLGYVDWSALSLPLDDTDQLEFVRGPAAALYGAGAFNGVLNVKTKSPRDSLGGKVRYTVGELDTQRLEFRQALALGRDWYLKALGGYHRSSDFTQSRVETAEYAPAALPRDLVAPTLGKDQDRLEFGGLRVDKYMPSERLFTFEVGTAHEQGPVTLSPLARSQATDVDQPWFRFDVASPRWNVLAYYTGNHLNGTRNLTANSLLYIRGSHIAVEAQGNRQFAGARGRVVAGVEFGGQTVDSADPNGAQTVYDRKRSTQNGSVFGQVEYRFTAKLNVVGSARWDRSTLYDGRLSPRVAAMYGLTPSQTLRVTYGRAFQVPNLTEYFLNLAVAPPIDLSPVESALAPVIGNTSLGLGKVPILAVGNNALRVERIDSAEIGYQGVIGGRLLVNVGFYRNQLKDFISNILPQVGTSLGRLNSSFGPYRPPSSLSPAAAATVTQTLKGVLPPDVFAALSNDAGGAPIVALLSFVNFGSATTDGVELGATYVLPAGLKAQGSYTGFHSSVSDLPESPLLPNTPGHQFSVGMAYDRNRIGGSVRYRWVDAFPWLAGMYAGPVPSYGVLDLNASYRLTRHVTAGADVANLLDNLHYEAFGGDLLGRRALGHLTYSW
ncbi:MAG TPA: TonB-dependent receptor [Vicinamibacterales bacterium]|nr:TonB-dependent receptor [Vicinamibacterales bacterium]